MINTFDTDNKDFDKFLNVKIYVNGLFLIESDEDKLLTLKINLSNFQNYKKEMCDVLRLYCEEKIKKYIIKKIKDKCTNLINMSRDNKIPIKNILYSYFINNRIDNIDIIWSASSDKEFKYVPVKHYLENEDDTLYLKTKKFKFKKIF
jgi:sugar-specific transcriptional regulator TrmB